MSRSVTGRLVSFVAVGVCAMVTSACAAGSTNAPGATSAPAAAPTSAPAAAAPIARPAASPAAAVAQSVAAPAPAPPGNQSPAEAAQLPITQATGRMVIYTTEIAILAQDLQLLPDRLGTLVLAHGGYVAGVETKADAGVPTVVVRLKVPPDQYEATMSGVRNLAVDVRSEKATTQDVTEEYSDTQAQ